MIFYCGENSCIPGIPGNYAGCLVDVRADGTIKTYPLPVHHYFEPATPEQEQPVVQEATDVAPAPETPPTPQDTPGEQEIREE